MKNIKKFVSLFLALTIVILSSIVVKADENTILNNYEDNNTFKEEFNVSIEGKNHNYIIVENFSNTKVIESVDGIVVEEYIYDKLENKLVTKNSDIEMQDVKSINHSNNFSLFSSSRPPIYESYRFSLSKLCTAVGITVSVSTLIGLIIASAGGAVVYTMSMTRAILTEAAGLSLTIGGLVTNHGIIVRVKKTWSRSCRSSECFEGYFNRSLVGHSIY